MDPELEKEPTYWGQIPASVRYDKNIPPAAKVLYAEIQALTNMRGICWATNKHLAGLYGVQPTRISAWVKQLEEAGYVRTKIIEGGFRGISVLLDPSGKAEGGVLKKRNHNNTVTNTKSIVDLEKSLLALVNRITGRDFRTLPRGSKKTLDSFSLVEIEVALTALAADPWHRPKLKELSSDYFLRASTIDRFKDQQAKQVSADDLEEGETDGLSNEERKAKMLKRMAG